MCNTLLKGPTNFKNDEPTVEVIAGCSEEEQEKVVIDPSVEIRLHFLRMGYREIYSERNAEDFHVSDSAVIYPTIGELLKDYNPYTNENYTYREINGGLKNKIKLTPEGEPEDKASVDKDRRLDEALVGWLPAVTIVGYSKALTPEFKGFFSRYPKGLNPGYVYTIDAEDPNDYKEYEINEEGLLCLTDFKYEKKEKNKTDIRKKSSKGTEYIKVEKGRQLWVCYSPVPWSHDFIEKRINTTDQKNKIMKKISCTGYKSDYQYLGVVFNQNQKIQADKLQARLDSLCEIERENEGKEDLIKEDMFIILEDHMSLAEEISMALDTEIVTHRAYIESIKYGEDIKKAKERINNNEDKVDINFLETKVSRMFSLAQVTYRTIYNNESLIKKYDGGKEGSSSTDIKYLVKQLVDIQFFGVIGTCFPYKNFDGHGILKEKLTTVLGVEDRKAQRSLIRDIRDCLGELLQSDYFTSRHYFFSDGSDLCCYAGKVWTSKYINYLTQNPHDYDYDLDLEKDIENEKFDNKAKWDSFITATCCTREINVYGGSYLSTTFSRGVNITKELEEQAELINLTIASSFAAFTTSSLEYISNLTEDHRLEILLDKLLNSISFKGKETIINGSFSRKAKKVLDSNGFKRINALLAVLNAREALQDSQGNFSLENTLEITGAVVSLTDSILQFNKLNKIAIKPVKVLGRQVTLRGTLGAVGGVIGAGLDIKSSIEKFKARDDDAAWAYAGAATAGLVAVFSSGGVALVAIAIGLIFYVLAEILTDTIQEAFFKSFVFSDYHSIEKGDDPTWKYNRHFVEKSPIMIGKDTKLDDKFLDYRFSEIVLINLMTSTQVQVIKSDPIRERVFGPQPTSEYTMGHGYTTSYSTRFMISIAFNMFLYSPEQIEFEVYSVNTYKKKELDEKKDVLFIGSKESTSQNYQKNSIEFKGIVNNKEGCYEYDHFVDSIKVEKKKNVAPVISIDLNLAKEFVMQASKDCHILFIFRLVLGEDNQGNFSYSPRSHEGKEELYFGTKISLYSNSYHRLPEQEFIIAPKKAFLDHTAWLKKQAN